MLSCLIDQRSVEINDVKVSGPKLQKRLQTSKKKLTGWKLSPMKTGGQRQQRQSGTYDAGGHLSYDRKWTGQNGAERNGKTVSFRY